MTPPLTVREQRALDTLRMTLHYLTGRRIDKGVYQQLLGEIRDRIAELEGYKMTGGHL